MKIKKDEYMKMKEYFNKINSYELHELDLSDFDTEISEERIKQWEVTGFSTNNLIDIIYIRNI